MPRAILPWTASTRRRFAAGSVLAMAWLVLPPPACAATEAGTRVVNVATVRFAHNGTTGEASSNPVTLTVAELLDIAIAAPPEIAGVDASVVLPFTITNVGNAAERYTLTAQADRAGVTVTGFAADVDGDGIYDPAIDRTLSDPTVTLVTGQPQRLFVLIQGDGAAFVVHTVAAAVTGHGAPGTIFAGAGEGGGDAVVGRSGATAAADTRVVPGTPGPTLVKTQSVAGIGGSGQAAVGAIVTYRLDARFPGPAAVVEIVDPIPAGTRFVAGSITIDGRAATDAPGDDAAGFDGTAVRVTLGDIATASVRSITFNVEIK